MMTNAGDLFGETKTDFKGTVKNLNDSTAAIKEKLQRDGKTLVWLYAVGTVEDRGEPAQRLLDHDK